jgi:hypothetical protein
MKNYHSCLNEEKWIKKLALIECKLTDKTYNLLR